MIGNKQFRQRIAVVLLFAVTGFVLYYPVMKNTFLSDDYDSLYRIYIEKRIIYREFLRPMIDVSFYFNSIISGTAPWSYYLFNVVVHIANAVLVFRLAHTLEMFGKKDQYLFSVLAGFLFLIYPFHNESISWLSGRLSSMACFFAMLALLISRERKGDMSVLLSIACYLTGLLCYESIIVLPLVVIILNRHQYLKLQKFVLYSLYWTGAAGVYLLARLVLSGTITGDYGSRVSNDLWQEKMANIFKVIGRLFLPPSENTQLLTGLTAALLLLLVAVHWLLFKRKVFNTFANIHYRSLALALAIGLLIPIAFSISTRTSESDRLLYFPSCFLCILGASVLIALCRRTGNRVLAITVISFYSMGFLELNNAHWIKASSAAQQILRAAQNPAAEGIVFINVPEEIDGAFVFRNGFKKALELNHISKDRVQAVNILSRKDYVKVNGPIVPVLKDSVLAIFPATSIMVKEPRVFISNTIDNKALSIIKERNLIYYWNKESLIRLF